MATITDKLWQLLTGPVDGLGYELVHIELASRGRERILRLYIDAPGGIRVDDCETVSHQVSALLDVEDPLPGGYLLEVSSPGLDRPLVKPGHFRQFIRHRAKVVTSMAVLGRRRFTGLMVAADDDGIVMEVEGENYTLAYSQIESARLVPVF